jgi:hypothetical protein
MFLDRDTLTWIVEPTYNGYHLYRGDLDILRNFGSYTQASANSNVEQFCGLAPIEVPFVDNYVPVRRDEIFYLVTQDGLVSEGTLGIDGTGAVRFNGNSCP